MTTQKGLGPIRKIAKYTFVDDVRQRSFVVMFAILVIIVLLSRGCYQGNYMINGRPVDTGTVVGAVSQVTFHTISVGLMLITALLSMRLLKRDRDDGMQSSILSKPIARWQYIVGKVLGIWFLSALFMFMLHFIVFLIASLTLNVVVPGYLIASLLASFNLLFVIITVLLFALLMPDIVAVLCVIGIGIVGVVGDGLYALSQSQIAQMMLQQPGFRPPSGMTFWKVIYYVWPKLAGSERFASSFVDGSFSPTLVYPFINILLYCLVLGSLLLLKFRKQEIT
jgi:ABC-type transport system involved in multi-copper enzyme maturation permease subunit